MGAGGVVSVTGLLRVSIKISGDRERVQVVFTQEKVGLLSAAEVGP